MTERESDKEKLRDQLFSVLYQAGAALVGTADLKEVIKGRLCTGVSVAVPVSAHIVEDLKTAPTMEYYNMYNALNARLDRIVLTGAGFLKDRGFNAMANTTETVEKDENWRTPLPHKTVATRAGLGWIGKSCLLVTEEYGSAVRLSSLITDAPLPVGIPIDQSRCGKCQICVRSCPAGALKGTLWARDTEREEIFVKEECKKTQIERMRQATGIETDLCGLCFAVCPYTQRYLKRGR